MSSVARAFDDHRREELFRPRSQSPSPAAANQTAWQVIRNGEMPPLMLQLRFHDGRIRSFAYSDLREIRYRDAGSLQLCLCGMSRLLVAIEGRNLRELVELLGSGLVYWLQEADERDVDTPESSPCIISMVVSEVTEG